MCSNCYVCSVPYILVVFYVLFVCKCVLYYCYRVTTQLQLTNASYHIQYIYIYIFIYLSPPRLIRRGFDGADWQTVELQVFLSAKVTFRIASVSEVLQGK